MRRSWHGLVWTVVCFFGLVACATGGSGSSGAGGEKLVDSFSFDSEGWVTFTESPAVSVGSMSIAAWQVRTLPPDPQGMMRYEVRGVDAAGTRLTEGSFLIDSGGLPGTLDDANPGALIGALHALTFRPAVAGAAAIDPEVQVQLLGAVAERVAKDVAAGTVEPPPQQVSAFAPLARHTTVDQSDTTCKGGPQGGLANGYAWMGRKRYCYIPGFAALGAVGAVALKCGILQCLAAGIVVGAASAGIGVGAACVGAVKSYLAAGGAPACLAALGAAVTSLNSLACCMGVNTLSLQGQECSCYAESGGYGNASLVLGATPQPGVSMCVECPEGTAWNRDKQACTCPSGEMPSGVECSNDTGTFRRVAKGECVQGKLTYCLQVKQYSFGRHYSYYPVNPGTFNTAEPPVDRRVIIGQFDANAKVRVHQVGVFFAGFGANVEHNATFAQKPIEEWTTLNANFQPLPGVTLGGGSMRWAGSEKQGNAFPYGATVSGPLYRGLYDGVEKITHAASGLGPSVQVSDRPWYPGPGHWDESRYVTYTFATGEPYVCNP